MFGADAMALMSRKPELTFAKAYRMLGMYLRKCILCGKMETYTSLG